MYYEPINKKVLTEFFSATKKLAQLGIIYSKNYVDDISKYLCKVIYNLELIELWKPVGFDGFIGSSKVKVRFNNCPKGTPFRLV